MRTRGLRSLGSLFSGAESRLSGLAARASARAELCRRVRARLAPDIGEHVVHVRLEPDGAAVVTVDSAAWAARLHYDRQALIEALRAEGIEVERLKLRVTPEAP